MSSSFCSGCPQFHAHTDVFLRVGVGPVLEQCTGHRNTLAEAAHDLCNHSHPWDFDNEHLHEELC